MKRQKQNSEEALLKAMRRAGQRSRAPRGLAQATLSRMGLDKPAPRLSTRLAWGSALATALLAFVFAVKQAPRLATPSPSLAQAPVIQIAPKPGAHPMKAARPKALAQTQPSVKAIAPLQQQESQTAYDQTVGARSSAPALAQSENTVNTEAAKPSLPAGERPWGGSSQASGQASAHAASRSDKAAAPASFAITLKNSYFKPGLGQELKVELQLVQAGSAKLRILDANGLEVQSLSASSSPANAFTFAWDGKDAHGADAASGAYTLLIESPGRVDKRACVLVR